MIMPFSVKLAVEAADKKNQKDKFSAFRFDTQDFYLDHVFFSKYFIYHHLNSMLQQVQILKRNLQSIMYTTSWGKFMVFGERLSYRIHILKIKFKVFKINWKSH